MNPRHEATDARWCLMYRAEWLLVPVALSVTWGALSAQGPTSGGSATQADLIDRFLAGYRKPAAAAPEGQEAGHRGHEPAQHGEVPLCLRPGGVRSRETRTPAGTTVVPWVLVDQAKPPATGTGTSPMAVFAISAVMLGPKSTLTPRKRVNCRLA